MLIYMPLICYHTCDIQRDEKVSLPYSNLGCRWLLHSGTDLVGIFAVVLTSSLLSSSSSSDQFSPRKGLLLVGFDNKYFVWTFKISMQSYKFTLLICTDTCIGASMSIPNKLAVFFYPRPVLAFGYCRCQRVCVCMCVCLCVRQSWACPSGNSSTVHARITKFGPEM